ncbi:hypothetical protein [Methyloglobulus morosus]|uniref:hypothetical protein n=1 Tax=Methyloglobulus morosus TaxID=1410681 RepID=UPI0013795836|nr:hypothetical protein [Methyloglobulus morosus]
MPQPHQQHLEQQQTGIVGMPDHIGSRRIACSIGCQSIKRSIWFRLCLCACGG